MAANLCGFGSLHTTLLPSSSSKKVEDYAGCLSQISQFSSVMSKQTGVRLSRIAVFEGMTDKRSGFSVHAAWTRRSSGQEPRKNKKSFKQRTEKYMKPFILDIFISSKYVHAKVMHRVTSKVVSVATTNAKDLRYSLPSLTDVNACKTIGKLIADRSKEADVYAVTFELRKGEKLEGKLATVLDTVVENGITLV